MAVARQEARRWESFIVVSLRVVVVVGRLFGALPVVRDCEAVYIRMDTVCVHVCVCRKVYKVSYQLPRWNFKRFISTAATCGERNMRDRI